MHRTVFRAYSVQLALLISMALGACGDESDQSSGSECATGSEGCACTAGGACDSGLSCLSDLCVDTASGDGGGDTGGVAGDGDTGGVAGDGDGDTGGVAGDGDGDGDTGGVAGDGDGDGDTGGMPTTGGEGGMGGGVGATCEDFEPEFTLRAPTIYILVDASSSMSELGFWEPLKTGVLSMVEELTSDVRFGFGTYTGNFSMCTGLTNFTPTFALDNYDEIASAYNEHPAPVVSMNPSVRQETPTPAAVLSATELLLDDQSPRDRYLLLVTDGEPDFCNDTSTNCAIDATVAALQHAHRQGISTLVATLDNASVNSDVHDYFAQAGAGELPNWSTGLDVFPFSGAIDSQCKSSDSADEWKDYRVRNGNAPDPSACDPLPPTGDPNCFLPAGDYSEEGGTTSAVVNSDAAALANALTSRVEALRSCTFDLNFDVLDESAGEVFVLDLENPIPAGQWQMNTPSQLELTGAACSAWKDAEDPDFFAAFPCEAMAPATVR